MRLHSECSMHSQALWLALLRKGLFRFGLQQGGGCVSACPGSVSEGKQEERKGERKERQC